MSTRSTLTIRDEKNGTDAYSIYRHCDGYPDTEHGVFATLSRALPFAWKLPRFDATDFAATIIAAWKEHGGGNIYMTTAEEVEFKLPPEQWRAFLAALDKPAESHPALRRLLTEPSVIELAIRQAPRYSEEAVTELLAVAEKVCLTDKGYPKAGLEVLRDALRKVQGERGSKA